MHSRPAASTVSAMNEATTHPSDWRSELLDQLRALIVEALPEVVEEVKWRKALESGWRCSMEPQRD